MSKAIFFFLDVLSLVVVVVDGIRKGVGFGYWLIWVCLFLIVLDESYEIEWVFIADDQGV